MLPRHWCRVWARSFHSTFISRRVILIFLIFANFIVKTQDVSLALKLFTFLIIKTFIIILCVLVGHFLFLPFWELYLLSIFLGKGPFFNLQIYNKLLYCGYESFVYRTCWSFFVFVFFLLFLIYFISSYTVFLTSRNFKFCIVIAITFLGKFLPFCYTSKILFRMRAGKLLLIACSISLWFSLFYSLNWSSRLWWSWMQALQLDALEFGSWFPTVWSWRNCLTSLKLIFQIWNGANIYLVNLLWELRKMMDVKCLVQ